MSAWSTIEAFVDRGNPAAAHMASTERPTPSMNRPSDSACAVIARDANSAGWRDCKCVMPEAILVVEVTWLTAPTITPRSFVPQRSLSHTVRKPKRSAA